MIDFWKAIVHIAVLGIITVRIYHEPSRPWYNASERQPEADWAFDGGRILGHVGDDVCVWDAGNGQMIQRMAGHQDSIVKVQFSPDGRMVLSSSLADASGDHGDTSVRIWDLAKGVEVRRFDRQSYGIFDPQAKNVATVDEHSSDSLGQLAFDRSGHMLIATGKGLAHIYNSSTGSSVMKVDFAFTSPVQNQFDASGDRMLVNDDRGLRVLNTRNGRLIRRIGASGAKVADAELSHDGQRIVSTDERTVKLWDANSGVLIRSLPTPGLATHVLLSPDDSKCVIQWTDESRDGARSATLWDLRLGRSIAVLETARVIGFSPDGKTLLGGGKPFIVYDAETGSVLRRLEIVPSEANGPWTNDSSW